MVAKIGGALASPSGQMSVIDEDACTRESTRMRRTYHATCPNAPPVAAAAAVLPSDEIKVDPFQK
jgi:hypothetical protein